MEALLLRYKKIIGKKLKILEFYLGGSNFLGKINVAF
jgi:hypothetical protein